MKETHPLDTRLDNALGRVKLTRRSARKLDDKELLRIQGISHGLLQRLRRK